MSVLSGQGLAKGTVRAALVTAARMLGSLVAVMAIYYLLPVRLDDGVSDVPWLLLDVVLFAALVGAQLPLIGRSRHPSCARSRP